MSTAPIAQGPVDVNVSRLPRELPEELAAATNGGYEDWAIAEKAARVELEQECNDLREENERLKRGEFICQRCGLRKDSERSTDHEF